MCLLLVILFQDDGKETPKKGKKKKGRAEKVNSISGIFPFNWFSV